MTRSPLSRWSLIPMMAAQIASGQEYVSTFLLNRDNDLAQAPSSPNIPPNGTNLEVQGGANIIFFPGGGNSGIVLGSTSSVHNHEAGRIQGNSGSVVAVATYVQSSVRIGGSASMNWRCAPNGPYCPPLVRSDQDRFTDPFDLPSKTGEIRVERDKQQVTDEKALRPLVEQLLTQTLAKFERCALLS